MSFKIVEGSFGDKGRIEFAYTIQINSAVRTAYEYSAMSNIEAVSNPSKIKFSIGSVLIGVPVFCVGGYILFGIVGLLIGIILTAFGCMYSFNRSRAELEFNDGKKVVVVGGRSNINKLIAAFHAR
jgi:hypothetical protein